MEARVIKLIECIESNKSQDLSQISAFQLGQLSKESFETVLEKVHPLLFSANTEIRHSGALAFSEILTNTSPLCFPPSPVFKLKDLISASKRPYKKQKIEESPYKAVLTSFRDLIFEGTWDERHGSFLGIKVLISQRKLCKKCEEDFLCRVVIGIVQDQQGDYSGDLAEFPLRKLGAQILALASPGLFAKIEAPVLAMFDENPLGILMCLRKAKIHTDSAFNAVLNALRPKQNEDTVTEACHYLAKFPLKHDQRLTEKVLALINTSDSLSSFIKYAIKTLDKLFNLNCVLPTNFNKIYTLFVHSLTEVRISTFSAFLSLAEKNSIDVQKVFLLTSQALILETNEKVLKSAWALIKRLLQKFDFSEIISAKIVDWNLFCSCRSPKNYEFFILPEKNTSAEEVYSFADNNTEEDIKSLNYLEKKQIERIWRVGKIINEANKSYKKNLAEGLQIGKTLMVLSNCTEDLQWYFEIMNAETESKLESFRIKALAIYKLSKLCIRKGFQLPDKVSGILQAVVTAYMHESHSLYMQKIAKTAARLTYLLKNRSCNEKFIKNMLKISSYQIIFYLQDIHQKETPSLFEFYNEMTNMEYLTIITEYIHPSLFPYFNLKFGEILGLLPNEQLIRPLLSILTQVPQTLTYFVEYLITYLSNFPLLHTDPLKVLKEFLSHSLILFIPYAACLLLPLLTHLNTQNGPIVAEIFSETVYAVMLDSSESELPANLLKNRVEGMDFVSNLKGIYTLPEYVPRISLNGIQLRDYQKEGVAWMRFLAKFRLGGMLCDEMGLGKTIQSLCAIAEAHLDHPNKNSLIVCPASILGHWFNEAKNYLEMNVSLYFNESLTNSLIVVSYHALKNLGKEFFSHEFLYVILDEGHLLSNSNTKTYKSIKKINSQYRIILTGTPIQNKILEVWPYFDFLMPGFLGSQSSFISNYQKHLKPKKSEKTIKFKDEYLAIKKLNTLHKKILPFVLRRLKKDILKDLPDKIIQDYYIELNSVQKEILNEYYSEGNQKTQLEELSFLRKLCNHPRLIRPELKNCESPKIEALQDLLIDCEICEESGTLHKALIFTRMIEMLDIIESDLLKKHFPLTKYLRLDGSTPNSKRFEICEQFNNSPWYRLLIMTTEAGGLGLNLQSADVVIFVDHSWNPIKDSQAMDRTHRIGQKNVVNVYRLITKDTLEVEILGLQSFKTRLAQTLVNDENASMNTLDANSFISNIVQSRNL